MFRPIRSAKSLKNAFKQGKKDIPSAPFPGSCRSGWPISGLLVPEPPCRASEEFLEKANRCPAPFPAMAPICPIPIRQWTAPGDQTDFFIVAGNDSDPHQWTAPPPPGSDPKRPRPIPDPADADGSFRHPCTVNGLSPYHRFYGMRHCMARHLFPSFLGQTKVLRKAAPLLSGKRSARQTRHLPKRAPPPRKKAQTLTSPVSESRKKSRHAI